MAKRFTNQARQVLLDRWANINGPPAAVQSMSVDDSTTLLNDSTTNLGSPANLAAVAFDSLTRSGQTLTAVATFGTGAANFTHRRIVLHNIASGSVTGTSATVMIGHDQQTINKNSSTSIAYSMQGVLN